MISKFGELQKSRYQEQLELQDYADFSIFLASSFIPTKFSTYYPVPGVLYMNQMESSEAEKVMVRACSHFFWQMLYRVFGR